MFKITVEASSLEELKTNLAYLFESQTVELKTAPAEDFGYDMPEKPASSIHYPVDTPVADVAVPSVPAIPVHYPVAETLPSVPSESPDRDARGMKWDSRIHAASKALTKDGSWRYRRNVSDDVIKSIEQPATPLPVAIPVVAVPVGGFQPEIVPPIANLPPAAEPAQPLYTAPVAAVPTGPARIAHTLESFRANMIPTMVELGAKGVVTQAYVASLCQYFGVQNIWDVAQYEDKSRQLFEQFVQLGFLTNVG